MSAYILNSSAGPIFKDAAQCERVMYRTGQFIRNHWELFRRDPQTNKDRKNGHEHITDAQKQTNPSGDNIQLHIIASKIREDLVNVLTQRTAYNKDLMKMLIDDNISASVKGLDNDVWEGEEVIGDVDLINRLAEYDPKLIPCLGLNKL